MIEARANRTPLVAPGGIDHHVGDMTATFSADVPLGATQQHLAWHKQWLPIDGDEYLTMGQLVERNSTGPLRLGYGAWRDLLLGVQFLNGRDELITAGGRTVKNVAGYDLTKLMVGQAGILGKLITLTVRTWKLPAAAILARFAPDTAIVNRLIPTDLRPQWIVLTGEALFCGYLSDERTIDYYLAQLPGLQPLDVQRRTLEQDIAHRRSLWRVGDEAGFRAAVPPASVRAFVADAGVQSWVADPAFGIVTGSCPLDQATSIRDAAARFSGSVAFASASNGLIFDPPSAAQRALLERLKQAFDPDNKLKPLPWKR